MYARYNKMNSLHKLVEERKILQEKDKGIWMQVKVDDLICECIIITCSVHQHYMQQFIILPAVICTPLYDYYYMQCAPLIMQQFIILPVVICTPLYDNYWMQCAPPIMQFYNSTCNNMHTFPQLLLHVVYIIII